MSISRRHFLLGTAGAAAGLILPGYYRRALEFIDRTGQPLLETVSRPTVELSAFKRNWGTLPWTLCVGDPEDGPPEMTLRQFADRYGREPEDLLDYGDEGVQGLDALVDWEQDCFMDTWLNAEAPDKLAYEWLSPLDLGPDFECEDAVGRIDVEAGASMMGSYWIVEAADEISLSLLQERVNALKTGVRIKVVDDLG